MEPTTGLEPVTSSLPRRYSTTELRGLISFIFISFNLSTCTNSYGAGNETRTRNPQLGRLMLYQLSYSRPTRLLCRCDAQPDKKIVEPSSGTIPVVGSRNQTSRFSGMQWWRGEDSNLRRRRRQIYSLFPLATREPLHTIHKNRNQEPATRETWIQATGVRFPISTWSWRWDLNPQPADYKSAALPVELRQHEPC